MSNHHIFTHWKLWVMLDTSFFINMVPSMKIIITSIWYESNFLFKNKFLTQLHIHLQCSTFNQLVYSISNIGTIFSKQIHHSHIPFDLFTVFAALVLRQLSCAHVLMQQRIKMSVIHLVPESLIYIFPHKIDFVLSPSLINFLTSFYSPIQQKRLS